MRKFTVKLRTPTKRQKFTTHASNGHNNQGINSISVVETNTKSKMKTLVTTTIGSIILTRKAETNIKVKMHVFIMFLYSPTISNNSVIFHNPHLINWKIVKKIFYITLFFFVDVVISYQLILVPKNLQFFLWILSLSIICLPFPQKLTIWS